MQGGLPECDLPVPTYNGLAGWAARLATIPIAAPALARRLTEARVDAALCAMPAPLDLLMVSALRRVRLRYGVAVHDASLHPGDILPMQMLLQRRLLSGATALVALSGHVATQLTNSGGLHGRPLLVSRLSPLRYGRPPPAPGGHDGPLRLLSFGRLLPYKGLDLLAEALGMVGDAARLQVRVVGAGPEGPVLDTLRKLPGVTVENRWVPETEVGELLAWSDALVLSHTEASQSGVAAAAIAAGRWIVATSVGGITEQLAGYSGARLCAVDGFALAGAIRDLLANPPAAATAADPGAWQRSTASLAQQLAAALVKPPGPLAR